MRDKKDKIEITEESENKGKKKKDKKNKRPVKWKIKELRRRNRTSIFRRGLKPYIVLIVVVFIFSFVGAVNSAVGDDLKYLDLQIGSETINNEIVEQAKDYIANSTFISGMDEEFKTTVVMPYTESVLARHSFLIGLFSMNKSYVDRNMGEVVVLIAIISIIVWLITTFIKKTISVGEYRYYMEYRFKREVKIRRIFAPYGNGNWFKVFRTMTIYYLVMFLWLFTIVGVVVKAFQYIFVPLIVAENPSIRWRDAKKLSSQMTKGYKWKMFCTFLSYFYHIIGLFIPGLNLLVSIPVLDNSLVEMYYILRKRPDIDRSFFVEKGFDEKPYIDRYEAGEEPEQINPEFVMQDIKIKGSSFDENDKYKLTEFIFMFFLFSFVGWLWEVGLHIYKDHAFVNRGTMYGPWLPIYGAGGAFIIVLLSRFKNQKAKLFVLTMALCGVLEYITSFVLDFAENSEYWNYDDMFANFNGRVCLAGLVAFALGGFLGVYILGPLIKRLVERIGRKPTLIICSLCVTAFLIDMVCCRIFGPNSGEGIGTKLGMIKLLMNV